MNNDDIAAGIYESLFENDPDTNQPYHDSDNAVESLNNITSNYNNNTYYD